MMIVFWCLQMKGGHSPGGLPGAAPSARPPSRQGLSGRLLRTLLHLRKQMVHTAVPRDVLCLVFEPALERAELLGDAPEEVPVLPGESPSGVGVLQDVMQGRARSEERRVGKGCRAGR